MKTSKREKRASTKEREEPKFDSVLDVLYYDSRRIGLFISQYDDFGLLQQIEFTETNTETASDKSNLSVRAGPRSLRITYGKEGAAEDSGTDSSKRIYDPFWVIPLSFLDYLEERGLFHGNLNSANIGQIVLVKGQLAILDMGLLKQTWKIPEAKENALRSQLALNPGNDPAVVRRDVDVFFQLVENLPHAVQCILTSANNPNVWALLREEFITGSASDLALKYGVGIDGEWSLLGVVDAKPADQLDSEVTAMAIMSAIAGNGIAIEIARVAGIVRQMGRPSNALGITPLLIYRKIAN